MSGKKTKPVIGILAGSLTPAKKSGVVDNIIATSRTLLQPRIQSPNGLKSIDLGGVGLGIVAALEKSGETTPNKALFSRNLSRSTPIPASSAKNSPRIPRDLVEMEMGSSEEYTIVTCHGTNMSYVQVYYDGKKASVFHISPARSEEVSVLPATDFLNSCNMCRKKLHGKNIYMYRGEKAFCSTECRYKVIAMDERLENCSFDAASRSMDVSATPSANGRPIFTAGILAT